MKLSVVYHSGYGHTEVIAQSILRGAKTLIPDSALLTVVGFGEAQWARLAESQAIVFGAPTYMGSVSGPFKSFMDETSKIWMTRGWQDKVAGGFTVSGTPSGDKLQTLQQLSIFAAQHGMIWVGQAEMPGFFSGKSGDENVNRLGSSLGLMAWAGQESPEITPPTEDRRTAELFGIRVAKTAQRLFR